MLHVAVNLQRTLRSMEMVVKLCIDKYDAAYRLGRGN